MIVGSILDITDASAERGSVVLLAEGSVAGAAAVGRIEVQRGQVGVLDPGWGRNDRAVPVERSNHLLRFLVARVHVIKVVVRFHQRGRVLVVVVHEAGVFERVLVLDDRVLVGDMVLLLVLLLELVRRDVLFVLASIVDHLVVVLRVAVRRV